MARLWVCLGWESKVLTICRDENRAGVARSMGSSWRGNPGLKLQLQIGVVSGKIPKQEMEAIG